MNKQLDFLTEYPFQYLSDLLKDIKKDPLDFLNILSFHTRNDLKC